MKRETLRHPKTLDLAARLGVSRAEAIGFLTLLWDFTADSAIQGDVGKWPNGAIARACDWTGDPDTFVSALAEAKWLDPCPDHRFLIHHWSHHCERWVRAKLGSLELDFVTVGRPTVATIGPTVVATPPRDQTKPNQTEPIRTKPNRTKAAAPELVLAMPSELDSAEATTAAREWIAYRAERKPPIGSQKSLDALLKQWARAGPAAFIAAVENSIANGYQGLIAPTAGKQHAQRTGPGQRFDETAASRDPEHGKF